MKFSLVLLSDFFFKKKDVIFIRFCDHLRKIVQQQLISKHKNAFEEVALVLKKKTAIFMKKNSCHFFAEKYIIVKFC